MPFLTDLTTDDIVTLKCEDTDSVVKIRVCKRSGGKIRMSIDAGKEIRIKKCPSNRRKQSAGKEDCQFTKQHLESNSL